jgi:hypothetical protein
MAATPAQPPSAALQRTLDKCQVRRQIAAMLDGADLDYAERANDVVITSRRNRRRGRIHIEYATGYVTHQYTIWEPWGLLQGYQDQDGNAEAPVTADRIIAALTDQATG